MPAIATIRDLRNKFPKIRKLVETEGEVLLSESGKTKYRLLLHTERPSKAAPPVDYWARVTSYQPTPLSPAQSKALHEDNRGDR
jgi:hypothetical protein